MADTAGDDTSRIAVLVPAHNEERAISSTVAGLLAQTRRPERIVVVADNCTDRTADIARACGVEVLETEGNADKKAGALNQAWGLRFRRAADRRVAQLPLDGPDRRGGERRAAPSGLPDLREDDLVLVQDADSKLDPGFLEAAATRVLEDPGLGAVGGTFRGDSGAGLVGHLQRNEYCQPPGTMVTKVVERHYRGGWQHEQVPIEDLRVGDRVVSLNLSGTWIQRAGDEITDTAVRQFDGNLVRVTTPSGLSSRYTPEHWCVVRFGDTLRDKYVVYLMRKGEHFRVGKARGIANQDTHPQLGIMMRYNREQADDIWILSYHDTNREAAKAEQEVMWSHSIPGLLFKANVRTEGDWTQNELDELWAEVGNNRDRAEAALRAHGLDVELPLWGRKHNPQALQLRHRGPNVINAIHLRDGMEVLPESAAQERGFAKATEWEPVTVERQPYSGPVYSMDVANRHTYFADGIATHNCRYARDVRRLKGKCLVVTGTAAMFRAGTLRKVSRARLDGTIPAGDGKGGIYDTTVLTEDNELTFAILHLGYRVSSPKECTLTTEVMQNWRDLWNQRLRWKRGAVENCFQYGITSVTWRYWGRQLLTAFGVLVTLMYVLSLFASVVLLGGIHLQPLWAMVSLVFVAERVVTVQDRGWRRALAAATMYELVYDLFLQAVHAKAYADAMFGRERRW